MGIEIFIQDFRRLLVEIPSLPPAEGGRKQEDDENGFAPDARVQTGRGSAPGEAEGDCAEGRGAHSTPQSLNAARCTAGGSLTVIHRASDRDVPRLKPSWL